MVKIDIGSRVGTKVLCGIIDEAIMEALPLAADDNEDGTATLKAFI